MATALRLGDIIDPRWENIDLEAGALKTITEKREQQHTIPIHTSFAKRLKTQRRGDGRQNILSELHGKAIGGGNGLPRKLLKLMKQAARLARSRSTACSTPPLA